MKNWISKYESNKEKKEQLKSQIELLSNELIKRTIRRK